MTNNQTGPWSINLWEYAVNTYACNDVKQHCLALQDEYQANVDIILWCCWLRSENIHLAKPVMDQALISLDTVSQATLIKLRSARRAVESTGAFTSEQVKAINASILDSELMIEKVLVSKLQELTRRELSQSQALVEGELNLEYYFEFLDIHDGATKAETIRQLCGLRNLSREFNQ